jgi:hypothetical protein
MPEVNGRTARIVADNERFSPPEDAGHLKRHRLLARERVVKKRAP